MPEQMAGWRAWVAPGVLIAGLGLGFTVVSSQLSSLATRIENLERRAGGSDEKIDRRAEAIERRIGETNQRIDRSLELMIGIRSQLDRVADRLQVTDIQAPATTSTIPSSEPTDPAKRRANPRRR